MKNTVDKLITKSFKRLLDKVIHRGFITHEDSRAFWRAGYPANVWIATDCRESRHWVARNNGVSKTKDQAQTLVTAVIDTAKTAWK
mgnify:CR=1 FL=1